MNAATHQEASRDDIRPVVARRDKGFPLWVFLAALAVGAGLLFYALELRRERIIAPTISATRSDYPDAGGELPPLAVPAENAQDDYDLAEARYPSRFRPGIEGPLVPPYLQRSPMAQQSSESMPRHGDVAQAMTQPIPRTEVIPPSAPSQIFTPPPPPNLSGQGQVADDLSDTAALGGAGKERVRAARLVNPATTVPKGTVIQAVLETALDSTRAGFARAIVSRDVFGFDGSKVLIPRGSRIIGEYKSDVSLGQKRVLIQWQRLTRPDGVIIDMDSPSADPLGRAGVQGKVNSHFLQRFAGAILQSALNVGTQLASQRVSRDTIYVGLPGVSQAITVSPEKIPPTIKVKQGSSVSVFVARDLDFTSVD